MSKMSNALAPFDKEVERLETRNNLRAEQRDLWQPQPKEDQWQEEDTALDLVSPEAGVDTMGDDYPTEGQNSQRVH